MLKLPWMSTGLVQPAHMTEPMQFALVLSPTTREWQVCRYCRLQLTTITMGAAAATLASNAALLDMQEFKANSCELCTLCSVGRLALYTFCMAP